MEHQAVAPLIRYPPSNNSLLSSGNAKKATIAYEPRTEAISPALNDDTLNNDDSTSRSTKDEQTLLVEKLKKVEAEILQTDLQISRLRKQKAQLEQAAASCNSKDDDDQENVCDTKQLSIAKLVYHENRAKAQKAHAKLDCFGGFSRDLPIYNQPSDNAIYHYNAAKFTSSFKTSLISCFRDRLQARLKLEEQVSAEYDMRMEKWLKRIEQEDSQPSKRLKDAKTREFFEKQFPELKKARESGERFSRVGQRVARSDAELDEILDGITEREDQDKKVKSYAVIPPMLEEMRARKPKYINTNGYVEDIITEYKEYQILNTWTDEEKDIFRENYLQHPKNFALIASMTTRKSVANCVEYYYMSKKSENYKSLLKGRQKRRTRSFVRPAQQTPALTTATTTTTTTNTTTTATATTTVLPSTTSSVAQISSTPTTTIATTNAATTCNASTNSTTNSSNNNNNNNNNDESTNIKSNGISSKDKFGGDNIDPSGNQNQQDLTEQSLKSGALDNSPEAMQVDDEYQTNGPDQVYPKCCACNCRLSETSKFRNVTRSNHQIYGIGLDSLKAGMKICYPCRFRHVRNPDLDLYYESSDIEDDVEEAAEIDEVGDNADTSCGVNGSDAMIVDPPVVKNDGINSVHVIQDNKLPVTVMKSTISTAYHSNAGVKSPSTQNELQATESISLSNSEKNQKRTCVRDIIYQAIEMSFQKSKSPVANEASRVKPELPDPCIQPDIIPMNQIVAQHSISTAMPLKTNVASSQMLQKPLPPQAQIPITNLGVDHQSFNPHHQLHQAQLQHQRQQQLQMEYNLRQQQQQQQQQQQHHHHHQLLTQQYNHQHSHLHSQHQLQSLPPQPSMAPHQLALPHPIQVQPSPIQPPTALPLHPIHRNQMVAPAPSPKMNPSGAPAVPAAHPLNLCRKYLDLPMIHEPMKVSSKVRPPPAAHGAKGSKNVPPKTSFENGVLNLSKQQPRQASQFLPPSMAPLPLPTVSATPVSLVPNVVQIPPVTQALPITQVPPVTTAPALAPAPLVASAASSNALTPSQAAPNSSAPSTLSATLTVSQASATPSIPGSTPQAANVPHGQVSAAQTPAPAAPQPTPTVTAPSVSPVTTASTPTPPAAQAAPIESAAPAAPPITMNAESKSPAREDSRSPMLTGSPTSPKEMVIDESAEFQSSPTSSEHDEAPK